MEIIQNNLEYRIGQIEREKSAVDLRAMENIAHNERKHMKTLFVQCDKSRQRALNWRTLDFGQREKHFIKLVRHGLKFGGRDYSDVKIAVAQNDSKTRGVMGAATANKITGYTDLLKSDNHDDIVKTAKHEVKHVKQFRNTETTLSRDTVENCARNYVQPFENFKYYKENPLEIEANVSGDMVSRDFTRALRKRDFAVLGNRQRVA